MNGRLGNDAGTGSFTFLSAQVGRRHSLDTKIDPFGIRLLQICRDTCLRIMNGRLGNEAGTGSFTFLSAQGRSVIDYVLYAPPPPHDLI